MTNEREKKKIADLGSLEVVWLDMMLLLVKVELIYFMK